MLHQLKTDVSLKPEIDSEVADIKNSVDHKNQVIQAVESYTHNDDPLEVKLQKFDQEIISKSGDDIPSANRLLRPAMIAALCEFKPISKSEFLE